jgi:WD40 repeat protein
MPIVVSKLHTFTGHKDCVYTLEKSAHGHIFFSGAGDGMVVKWDLQAPEQGKLLAKVSASVYAIHYDISRNQLIVGQNYEGIHRINLENKEGVASVETAPVETDSVKLTEAAIFDIATWNGKIFVGDGNGVITVVDAETLGVIKRIRASKARARAMAVHPHRQELAAGYSDNTIRIVDLNSLKVKQVIEAHKNSVFTLCYSPDYRMLLSGSRDAHLKIWNVDENYTLQEAIVAHMYTINHISFSPDGKYFVTCSMDKSVKIWDARHFKLLKVIDKARYAGHGTSVNRTLWPAYATEDGKYSIISASDDRTISMWDVQVE